MNQIYGPKNRSDEQQLYETPPEVTENMLHIARLYGFFPENTVIGELFDGNGMMSRVAREENLMLSLEINPLVIFLTIFMTILFLKV